jgi:hypothetical protein
MQDMRLTFIQLFPSVIHVANKYKGKLDRDDIKRFAKECSKKLVNSDFKNKRVTDPSKIDPKQEKAVKKFVTEFFERAVVKKKEHDQRKGQGSNQADTGDMQVDSPKDANIDGPSDIAGIDSNNNISASLSPANLKRARNETSSTTGAAHEDDPQGKKARVSAPGPPLPPPPPAGGVREEDMQTGSDDYSSAEGFSIKGAAAGLQQRQPKYAESPMQTATPPTTNSPDAEERERRRREFSGLNADRMKNLGFLNGANNR